jgi:hypothetical protein
MQLIAGFFESYLQLNAKEEKELENEIRQLESPEAEKAFELITSWERRGRSVSWTYVKMLDTKRKTFLGYRG